MPRSPAAVFVALGDETRLRLLSRLAAGGSLSIAALSEAEPISRQAITKHLGVLADAGLVRGDKHGREVRWELTPAPLAAARTYLDRVEARWDARLARLKALVEGEP